MLVIKDTMRNNKQYDGNSIKFGVTINNQDYIIKFSKKDSLSIYCEYIASRFIRELSIPCHEVYLGVYKNDIVNVIKDFTSGRNITLHSYKDTKQSSEDTETGSKEYTYNDVLYMIEKHKKMSRESKLEAKQRFWDMFICDSILANRDRHWGNWGYVSNGSSYRFAPLYDNGGCLFPNVDCVIHEYVNTKSRKKFLKDRVFIFPASLFKMEKVKGVQRTNFFEMYKDLRINKIFASRVKSMRSRFSSKDIFNIIFRLCFKDSNLHLLDVRYKRFYVEIITLRYKCIVLREDYNKAYKEVEEWLKENGL